MKKSLLFFIMAISVFVSCFVGCTGNNKNSADEPVCAVRYWTDGHGTIQGEIYQELKPGERTSEVTAVPDEGYRFVGWSDSVTESTRSDIAKHEYRIYFASFEKCQYNLNYDSGIYGHVEGVTNQTVFYGESAWAVTAIPDEGCEFVQWSDGVTTAQRLDMNVKSGETITALFKRIYVRFKLDYRSGTADTDMSEVIFYENDFKAVKFPVPTREHYTFGGWYIGEKQVTDENGTMVIGKELLQCTERKISAKWIANENYTYKILMVYVTELDAVIPSIRGNGNFDVYYKMSDFDIEICKTITKQMDFYLNDMLDGLVTFEVDEYFTTQPVGNESIRSVGSGSFIDANDIPEIFNSGIYEDYQSILTVFCMDDYDHEFRDCAGGVSYAKYGTVFLESVYDENLLNGDPLEDILDTDYWRWYSIIEPFIHELSHTIELQMNMPYEYHKVIGWAHSQLMYDHLLMNRLFYNNMIEIDGKITGIPLGFWKGDFVTVKYSAGEGGTLFGAVEHKVVRGQDGRYVTALAGRGYEFVQWSDGVTTPTRSEFNVTEDFTVTAIFKRIY